MARASQAVLFGLAALLLAGCAPFGVPVQREVLISTDRLNELLARRLIVDRTVLDVFQLRTGKPVAVLDPEAQRLRVDLDLGLMHPFSPYPLEGQAAISGGLAFDSATRTVLLTEPRVEQLHFAAVPAALRDAVSRMAGVLGSELLDQYPLARLEPAQLTFLGQEYRVLGFDVAEEGLKVILRAKR